VLSVPLAEQNPSGTPVLSCSPCMNAVFVHQLVLVWWCALACLQLHGTSRRLVRWCLLGVAWLSCWDGMAGQSGSVSQFLRKHQGQRVLLCACVGCAGFRFMVCFWSAVHIWPAVCIWVQRGAFWYLSCLHPATTGWQYVLGECAYEATRIGACCRRLCGVCGL
jgi:hypothetical protein